MLFQRTDRLHQCSFEVIADTHNLSGRLHLSGQCSLGTDKFIKRKSRNLYDAIIQHRLETCVSLLSYRILDLIQCITQCNLCSYLRDRITGRLGSQCRRTAHTRVYFDDTIFKCGRVQCILYITSSGDIQFADDVQRRSTQHLVFFIAQSLGRCHYNTVSGMHSYRVNIFHITYGDAVSVGIPHYFILDFFPAGNTTLYQNLSHTGKSQTIFQDFL